MKKNLIIAANDSGQRVDKFLTKAFPNLPQSALYKAIRKKDVRLNGRRCEISTKLQTGDALYLYLPEDFLQQKPKEWDFLKAPKALDIVYEDENLMLLDKKPGLIVHPDENYHFDSLIARVQHVLYDRGEYRPEAENAFAPALVNRIDRNTQGIVMAAKNAETLRILNQKVKDREVTKLYLCVVCGSLEKKEGTLTGYLVKNESQNRVYISAKPVEGAKTILTKYRVLEEASGKGISPGKESHSDKGIYSGKGVYSLVEVDLLTGRTHQIRAHFASIGHPLLGDGKYGINSVNKSAGLRWQALCSYKLRFSFTSDGGILQYLDGQTFTAGEPWFLRDFYRGFSRGEAPAASRQAR